MHSDSCFYVSSCSTLVSIAHEEGCLRYICFIVSGFLLRYAGAGLRKFINRAGVSAADTAATGDRSVAAPVLAAAVLQGMVAGVMMGEGSLMLCLMS